jgi:hypothetical protein
MARREMLDRDRRAVRLRPLRDAHEALGLFTRCDPPVARLGDEPNDLQVGVLPERIELYA